MLDLSAAACHVHSSARYAGVGLAAPPTSPITDDGHRRRPDAPARHLSSGQAMKAEQ